MKKVKVCSSWTNSENILKRLLCQFKTSDEDMSNIEFVNDGSEEVVVFFGYITEEISSEKQYYIFPQEPSWTGGHQKSLPEYDNLTLFGFDKDLYNSGFNFVESHSFMFYGSRGPESEEWWNIWNYDKIKNNRPKCKKISSIISYLGRDYGDMPSNCLYKKRIKMVENIIERSEFVDVYSWESNGTNVKGWLREKSEGLIDYKFSICVENSREKNYISEKFFDCILNDTIPIYFGCENIKDIIPENGYILIDDIDNINEIIEKLWYINENSDELYNRLIPNCRKIKERYFSDFNPLKKINELCS
jgi:hypothetical protein